MLLSYCITDQSFAINLYTTFSIIFNSSCAQITYKKKKTKQFAMLVMYFIAIQMCEVVSECVSDCVNEHTIGKY